MWINHPVGSLLYGGVVDCGQVYNPHHVHLSLPFLHGRFTDYQLDFLGSRLGMFVCQVAPCDFMTLHGALSDGFYTFFCLCTSCIDLAAVYLLEKCWGSVSLAANHNTGLSAAELNVQRNAVDVCHLGGGIQQRSASCLCKHLLVTLVLFFRKLN